MIMPNKFISFEKSVLSKLEVILNEGDEDIEIYELYKITQRNFNGIDQYLYALDVLYVLGRIDIDLQTRTVRYVS